MKTRFIALLLVIVMALGLAACSADADGPVADGNGDSTVVTIPSPNGTGLPGIPRGNTRPGASNSNGNGLSGIPRGGKTKTDPEKQLKPFGTIETLTKSVKTPSKPDTKNTKMDNNYGTIDWSTAANGYITFTAKDQPHVLILQGPNGVQTIARVAKGDNAKIALVDGTGKYQYAIANLTASGQHYYIQYKNSFQVKSIDTDLAPYLISTAWGDYENAPNATAKAKELWDSSKTRLDNVKAIANWVGDLKYDDKLKQGSADVYVNPDSVIKNGGGVCNEFSKLLAAMLRSQGIPAYYRIGSAPYDNKGTDGSHAWVVAWVEISSETKNGTTYSTGAWVSIEATSGRLITNTERNNRYSDTTINYAN